MKTQGKQIETASKFLSLVLRHAPQTIGLTLDGSGWANVDELISLANAHGQALSRALVEEIVETSDKKRFALNEDRSRIRANQGHSVEVDLGLEPREPPDILFHGTADRFLAPILSTGVNSQARQHVHLSSSVEVARSVGVRHGRPVILVVDAKGMQRDGHRFHLSENGVWLTSAVPPQYMRTLGEDGHAA